MKDLHRFFYLANLVAILVIAGSIPSVLAETKIKRHKDWQIRTITDDFTDEVKIVLNGYFGAAGYAAVSGPGA